MVVVAQLVEPRIVVPVVAGSSPVYHPIFFRLTLFVACEQLSKEESVHTFKQETIIQ